MRSIIEYLLFIAIVHSFTDFKKLITVDLRAVKPCCSAVINLWDFR